MFRIQRMHFIIATAHRVSEGMDAVGPCDSRSQGRRPAASPMRAEPEFRLKRDVALAPQANVAGPALLQGGGVALMFGGLAGQGQ